MAAHRLETPDDYYRYFLAQFESNPTSVEWQAGHTAATLWREYTRTPAPDNLPTLTALIGQLLPYRWSGSGFYAFWLTILQHLSTLTPIFQAPLFLTIFDPTNHGNRPIEFSEQARSLVQQWRGYIDTAALDSVTLESLAVLAYPYFASSTEWFTLTTAIDLWIKSIRSDYDFLQELTLLYNRRKSS